MLLNLEHRGACGCEKNTGDGAGILLQMPHAFLADEAGRAGVALPGPGGYGAGLVFLPTGRRRPPPLRGARSSGRPPRRACPSSAGATCRPTTRSLGATARAGEPVMRQAFVGRPEPLEEDLAYERKLYVLRRRIENAVRASDVPGRGTVLRPQPVAPHARLQGDADRAPAAGLLPGHRRPARRVGAGDGALALLDQHLPELGARAPLPLRLPQRRDQHPARQRQLDARAREPVRVEAVRRRPEEDPARDRRATAATRRCSTTCSSCWCWPAAPCRTP